MEDSVTSRTLPSENVARSWIGDVSPGTPKAIPDVVVEIETGVSVGSTSIRIGSDSALCPDVVTPRAVSVYDLQAMFFGIVKDKVAGTAVCKSLKPICSPRTATCVNGTSVGEETDTARTWPG